MYWLHLKRLNPFSIFRFMISREFELKGLKSRFMSHEMLKISFREYFWWGKEIASEISLENGNASAKHQQWGRMVVIIRRQLPGRPFIIIIIVFIGTSTWNMKITPSRPKGNPYGISWPESTPLSLRLQIGKVKVRVFIKILNLRDPNFRNFEIYTWQIQNL